MTSDDTQPLVG